MLKTLKHIFQFENIPWVYLRDILMTLLAKLRLDVSFMCLSRFERFVSLSTIYVVERNVVVYCHAYI